MVHGCHSNKNSGPPQMKKLKHMISDNHRTYPYILETSLAME